ncbi:MAG: hypothetical protein ACLQUZ_03645 [Rhizomicrobium sp.]
MGVARLLAKGWIAFCLFAGAHAVVRALAAGVPPVPALQQAGLCIALFGAMGLLFIGGYAASASHSGMAAIAKLRPFHVRPGFDEYVFVVFAVAIFVVQTVYAPQHQGGGWVGALQLAVQFAVPGQRLLEGALAVCGLDGGMVVSSAFAWLLAFVFLGSALSRIRLAAAIVRLERKGRPEILGAAALVFVLGLAAVVAFQLLFMGSAYQFVPCWVFAGIPGAVLIGIAPLMLAYMIKAALTDLLALGPEG